MSTDDALKSAGRVDLLLLLLPLLRFSLLLLPLPLLLQLSFGGSSLVGCDCGSTRLLLPGSGVTTQLAWSPLAAMDVLDNGRRLDVLSIVPRAQRRECRATIASCMADKALLCCCLCCCVLECGRGRILFWTGVEHRSRRYKGGILCTT